MFGGGGIRIIQSIIEDHFSENKDILEKSVYLTCVDCKSHIILEDKINGPKYLLTWVHGDTWSIYGLRDKVVYLETSTLENLIEKIVIRFFEHILGER